MNSEAKIADLLLSIKAVQLNVTSPYTWASGIKSPVYCDNRIIWSFPSARNYVINIMKEEIKKHFPEVQAICGVATGGIAPGILVADRLGLPFSYVRPEKKNHGLGKQIEGEIHQELKTVVIEDLISTGKSSILAINTLKDANICVEGLVSIFTYQFNVADQAFKNINCKKISLSNYSTLLEMGIKTGYINTDEIHSLEEWRNSPETWHL